LETWPSAGTTPTNIARMSRTDPIASAAGIAATLPSRADVLESLGEPLLLVNAELRIGHANAAAEALLGRSAEALLGMPLSEVVPGDYTTSAPHPGRGWSCRRAGSGWVVRGTPHTFGEDDVWAQRIIEAEQLAAVGQIAAGVAHEIGAPLTAISVAVEYLIRTDETGPETRRDLELILAQTQRISRLTRRLVELAKPSEPELGDVDLNAVVRESLAFVDRQLRRDAVEGRAELAPDLPPIRGDVHQLQQVVLNLLLNAHRALLSNPVSDRRVEVRTSRRGDDVELLVEDNGPGIAPDDLQRIFLPFFSRAESTGMGLTVVRNIVHQHGGTVEAHGAPAGATFHVRIPVTSDEDAT
jgi:signal transduction histidine kinase